MSSIKDKIEKAREMVSQLCLGKRDWVMSIPANPSRDPDLIICDALTAAEERIAELETILKVTAETSTDIISRFVSGEDHKHHLREGEILVNKSFTGSNAGTIDAAEAVVWTKFEFVAPSLPDRMMMPDMHVERPKHRGGQIYENR